MGFQKPNLDSAKSAVQRCIAEIKSPYNDGWTSSYCKHDLYRFKCWLNDLYQTLPYFQGEEEWEKERTFELLKQDHSQL